MTDERMTEETTPRSLEGVEVAESLQMAPRESTQKASGQNIESGEKYLQRRHSLAAEDSPAALSEEEQSEKAATNENDGTSTGLRPASSERTNDEHTQEPKIETRDPNLVRRNTSI